MPLLNAAQPITKDGKMEQPFREVMRSLTDQLPMTGTGTPEGVVNAPQFSLYLDTTPAASPVEYRKMLAQIGGDTTQGWIAVGG